MVIKAGGVISVEIMESRDNEMDNAILVIDMPSKCGECKLRMGMICTPTLKDIDSVNAKMDWCPLREVPQKKDYYYCDRSIWAYERIGYNACIDEIMKGSDAE